MYFLLAVGTLLAGYAAKAPAAVTITIPRTTATRGVQPPIPPSNNTINSGYSNVTKTTSSRDLSKSRWHPTVLESVVLAEQMLETTAEQRANRVILPLLSNRHSELCCMLTDLDKKLGHNNALDVFVFTVNNTAMDVFRNSSCSDRAFNIIILFMPLNEHWGTDPACSSSAVHNRAEWANQAAGEDYRRMGHWRLTFQFAFADLLGYKYLWQLDDDSYFRGPVDFSLVQHMQSKGLWVAGSKTEQDFPFVLRGLAELARLYLVAERMSPKGTLFDNHTHPQGLSGLFTVANDPTLDVPDKDEEQGWSRYIACGNNIIINMDRFWWPKEVQKFVELAVLTGYHWRFRWNEQGVIAMVWHIFVPAEHYQFEGLFKDYQHPRTQWGTC